MKKLLTGIVVTSLLSGVILAQQGNSGCPLSRAAKQKASGGSNTPAIVQPQAQTLSSAGAGFVRPLPTANLGAVAGANIQTQGAIAAPPVAEVSWVAAEKMCDCNDSLHVTIDDKHGVREEIRKNDTSGVVLCDELEKAAQAGQPVVVYFVEFGNKEVDRVEKLMFGDPVLVETLNKFTRLKIDIRTMDKDILRRFGISQAPTFLVLQSNLEIAHATSKMASRGFNGVLEETLKKEEFLKKEKEKKQ